MHSQRHLLTTRAPGSQCELLSLHYGAAGGRKAYIQAALHADEPPGLLVSWYLRQALQALDAAGQVSGEIVLVPMANPIGHGQRLLGRALGRFELASGENFNRYYRDLSKAACAELQKHWDGSSVPDIAAARAALRLAAAALPADSELLSLRRCLLQLAIDADVVLDLHCDNEAAMHLYTATPVWPQVEPLARLIGAEVSLLAENSGGEPFDEACSMVWAALNRQWAAITGTPGAWPDACVATTLELRGECDVRHDLAEGDAEAILAYLTELGFLARPRAELPPLKREPRPLEGSMPVLTPVGGLLVHADRLGQELRQGDLIAEVIDPLTGAVTALTSPVDGVLYARESVRIVHAGMGIAKVAGTAALRSGPLLSA